MVSFATAIIAGTSWVPRRFKTTRPNAGAQANFNQFAISTIKMSDSPNTAHGKSSLSALTLAAIGIVYGDIGTSPLYSLQTVFESEHGLALNPLNLFGVISLIFWGLTIIVTL